MAQLDEVLEIADTLHMSEAQQNQSLQDGQQ